ncbi:ankyrin repeat and zinc finger domain-containing protein 1-like [Papaver somniferum]|uniref:ankyrin repeat and zinc finger domain-containing protein 1-like n=1 Tax=Papaver somniferum TaxID=3469 RepID=UPI000E70457F|nr:ankyrin repeat and zinc finger domain-containing protein 1-like [Papaver somniferum]
MATENTKNHINNHQIDRRSVFDLPPNIFDSCSILSDTSLSSSASYSHSIPSEISTNEEENEETLIQEKEEDKVTKKNNFIPRWSCNTCKAEFESLQDQRSHFKSDHHRFNIKLSISGKDTIKEEDFDELASDSVFRDYDDMSSISGSEDEAEKSSFPSNEAQRRLAESFKRKFFIRLQTGKVVSLWKCLLVKENENLLFDNGLNDHKFNDGHTSYLKENELVERLKRLSHEPRDKSQLRIVLLASGGHFAGCVFDGNLVVAHKTFHRYVVRAKAGKQQSAHDGAGKTAHSAGASLRRYNELALKKEIQELLADWRPYFDASSCIFVNAPSNSRQLLYNGEKPYFSDPHNVVKHVPITVRRPTLKETKRIYDQLTNMVYEVDEQVSSQTLKEDLPVGASDAGKNKPESKKDHLVAHMKKKEVVEEFKVNESSDELSGPIENKVIGVSTPLHVAAFCGNTQHILELLELGLDPCAIDERGRTPYMLATEKEARNTFRRFMALNLDKWDWNAAKVPSPLTKEMEESQSVKQAEKDAKRKEKAKELKKLKKAKEKKAQAEAAARAKSAPTMSQGQSSRSVPKQQVQSSRTPPLSKEEELKREREKRALAAEKRMAAAAALAQDTNKTAAPPTVSGPSTGTSDGLSCSCCKVSLAGKVPFSRYNFKYCSTSCMHVHKELLEDE